MRQLNQMSATIISRFAIPCKRILIADFHRHATHHECPWGDKDGVFTSFTNTVFRSIIELRKVDI